ncbi:MAG: ABC transporter ATP-binding protein [Planctomycetes bacterium]|nr:ABC transporter ATP-binding protein [Planctomycetota bacterium]
MIDIRNLTKRYGEKIAVRDLSLTLREGEIFAFLGPNGAGKTTTIKIITGLVKPTSGTAIVGGHDIATDGLAVKALMSYVPDEPYLYDKLTAREFLRMIGDLYRMPPERLTDRIAKMIKAFELESFVDDLCESFSHGMKQRVVIASALLHEPRLLVIDEPMVGLDPKSARTLKDLLGRLAREDRVTIFMSTHTLSVAEELADRIGILSKGQLVALGTLEELRALQQKRGVPGHQRLEDLFLDLTEANGNGSGA